MTRILVLYGTTDGHTAKIAWALGETLRANGAAADVVEAHEAGTTAPSASYDGVIVAASVHVGGYQKAVTQWLRKHANELREKPVAFVSVCLGVLQNDPKVHAELQSILEKFYQRSEWRPNETKIVAGALPYSRYGWLKRWVMRRIARRAGVETDPRRDYEFTDWKDLERFAVDFLGRVRHAEQAGARAA